MATENCPLVWWEACCECIIPSGWGAGWVSDIWQGRGSLRTCAGTELLSVAAACLGAVAVQAVQPAEVWIRSVDIGQVERPHRTVVADRGAPVMDVAYEITMRPKTRRAAGWLWPGKGCRPGHCRKTGSGRAAVRVSDGGEFAIGESGRSPLWRDMSRPALC